MPRKAPTSRTTIFLIFLCLLFFAFYSLLLSRSAVSSSPSELRFRPLDLTTGRYKDSDSFNHVIKEDISEFTHRTRLVTTVQSPVDSVSVLLPNWEVLVLVSPTSNNGKNNDDNGGFHCFFPNNETSPANFSGVLPFGGGATKTFKCTLPNSNRRLRPFHQPILARLSSDNESNSISTAASTVMPRWDFLAYECFSTETDVVVFVKGVNTRPGINRSPDELNCVFGNENKTVIKTAVISSKQEIIRCRHPNLTETAAKRIKVSIEIKGETLLVPSVAYYTRTILYPNSNPNPKSKSQICATTMVYNVAKFLREWVMYYSKIGVDKFILYDNGSDDGLEDVVKELNEEDYKIERIYWVWPKTQEAGFSHSTLYAKDSCTWMMYVDVDEFIFSPSWLNNSSQQQQPSKTMLQSLLPTSSSIGQVSIKCNDFGPSGQTNHPVMGVTQGYNCRRQAEQRHKSILLLDAVDHSLLNAIHHFKLNDSYYSWRELPLESAVINHYKYQAWPEFMTKFRQRVSAFVADWKTQVNPMSKDRTPGLGFQPIKPDRWEHMFCDVKDERLKSLTRKWFGSRTPEGLKMAWQR